MFPFEAYSNVTYLSSQRLIRFVGKALKQLKRESAQVKKEGGFNLYNGIMNMSKYSYPKYEVNTLDLSEKKINPSSINVKLATFLASLSVIAGGEGCGEIIGNYKWAEGAKGSVMRAMFHGRKLLREMRTLPDFIDYLNPLGMWSCKSEEEQIEYRDKLNAFTSYKDKDTKRVKIAMDCAGKIEKEFIRDYVKYLKLPKNTIKGIFPSHRLPNPYFVIIKLKKGMEYHVNQDEILKQSTEKKRGRNHKRNKRSRNQQESDDSSTIKDQKSDTMDNSTIKIEDLGLQRNTIIIIIRTSITWFDWLMDCMCRRIKMKNLDGILKHLNTRNPMNYGDVQYTDIFSGGDISPQFETKRVKQKKKDKSRNNNYYCEYGEEEGKEEEENNDNTCDVSSDYNEIGFNNDLYCDDETDVSQAIYVSSDNMELPADTDMIEQKAPSLKHVRALYGMYKSAMFIHKKVYGFCRKYSEEKDYDIILTGHSYGAAVSNILALLLKKDLTNVTSVGFGTPGALSKMCYMRELEYSKKDNTYKNHDKEIEISELTKTFITNFIFERDFIPRLTVYNGIKICKIEKIIKKNRRNKNFNKRTFSVDETGIEINPKLIPKRMYVAGRIMYVTFNAKGVYTFAERLEKTDKKKLSLIYSNKGQDIDLEADDEGNIAANLKGLNKKKIRRYFTCRPETNYGLIISDMTGDERVERQTFCKVWIDCHLCKSYFFSLSSILHHTEDHKAEEDTGYDVVDCRTNSTVLCPSDGNEPTHTSNE